MIWIRDLPLGLLCAALLYAAWGDLRTRTIPNALNAAIALAAPLWWLTSGHAVWPDMAIQIGMALGLFTLFALVFMLGAMGGGDVKLIAAIALWLPPFAMLSMLQVMAIAGGLLTLIMLVDHKRRRAPGRPEVPYGVAIAGATLWVVANDILTALRH